MTAAQVRAGHREGKRPHQLAGLREPVLPSADEAAEQVEVEVERTWTLVDVQLRQRRLSDAGRTVEMDEARHQASLGPVGLAATRPARGRTGAQRGRGRPGGQRRRRLLFLGATEHAECFVDAGHGDVSAFDCLPAIDREAQSI